MWDLFGAVSMRYRDSIYSFFPKEIKGFLKGNEAVPESSDLVFQFLTSPYHYSSFLDDLKHWEKTGECAFSFLIAVEQLKYRHTFGGIIFILLVFAVLSTWKNIGLVNPEKQRKLTEKAIWKFALM